MIKQNTTWFDTYNATGDSDAAWGTLEAIDAREVKIIFLPTSNVFSTAYGVFIK